MLRAFREQPKVMNECRRPLVYCVFQRIKGFSFNQREGEDVKTFIDTLQLLL